MNRAQKIAWFNLVVIMVTLDVSIVAVGILTIIAGMPRALCGLGFGGICVFTLLSHVLFRKKRGQVGVSFDERDELIQRRAILAGFIASYCFFVGVCMTTWLVFGMDGLVPVLVLPLMVCWGYIALTLTESVAILVQYGWRDKDHE